MQLPKGTPVIGCAIAITYKDGFKRNMYIYIQKKFQDELLEKKPWMKKFSFFNTFFCAFFENVLLRFAIFSTSSLLFYIVLTNELAYRAI